MNKLEVKMKKKILSREISLTGLENSFRIHALQIKIQNYVYAMDTG